ncbi:MAG TPA: hypothetical protein DCQ52_03065 [Acidimicrobiaceae bacterium]|nr:hypothetical protein [Acidimicrobiaceae bacterium]
MPSTVVTARPAWLSRRSPARAADERRCRARFPPCRASGGLRPGGILLADRDESRLEADLGRITPRNRADRSACLPLSGGWVVSARRAATCPAWRR